VTLAKALQGEGWSVWWDRNIPVGKRFSDVIQEEIGKAGCIVVLWSAASVKKDWVIDEASEGRERKILVPVFVEQVQPPLGFRQIQAADLWDWRGDSSDGRFRTLCHNIASMLGQPSTAPAEKLLLVRPATVPWFRSRLLLRGVLWGTLAVFVGVMVYRVSIRDETKLTSGTEVTGRGAKEPISVPANSPTKIRHSGDIRTNSKDGLSYVWIPPGEFWMGATPGDKDAGTSEEPRHRVRISKGFWIGQTLVTVAAYKQFDEKQPNSMMPTAPFFNPNWGKTNYPIDLLTWEEAKSYCDWAGGRLPTEAEWEYAARAGKDGLKYPWGNEIAPENANYDYPGNEWRGTSPVRSYSPNAWALYDMAGNLWEWVADWYDKNYYSSMASGKPAEDPHGPDRVSGYRVERGGSYNTRAELLRTSQRRSDEPVVRSAETGFRCVLTSP
jgi:formylglycine-generating enzyme required for sulfatase activity